MCGIAGFTKKNFEPGADRIQTAADTLIHRGPDQQGVFETNLISLCATRLTIIDLESGDQPIVSDDGDTVIVFNGEIYNHAELRRERVVEDAAAYWIVMPRAGGFVYHRFSTSK